MTSTDIVLDASVLVRGLLRESDEATEIVDRIARGETRAASPDLIAVESTHALLRLTRAGRLPRALAEALINAATTLPIRRHASTALACYAFPFALGAGLSAYDGFYAVLAEGLELPLVTADARLAASVESSVLVA